jgi:putative addiction module component (TIGR02574 family)
MSAQLSEHPAGIIRLLTPRRGCVVSQRAVRAVRTRCTCEVTFTVIPWDNDGMNTESQQLLQSALALPESDRAEIAASLIHSLDSDIDNNIDEAWAQEIKQRIESIDKGQVKLIPWDDVMLEMGARRHG